MILASVRINNENVNISTLVSLTGRVIDGVLEAKVEENVNTQVVGMLTTGTPYRDNNVYAIEVVDVKDNALVYNSADNFLSKVKEMNVSIEEKKNVLKDMEMINDITQECTLLFNFD